MSNMYYNHKTGKWVTKRNRGYRSSRGYNRGGYSGGYGGGYGGGNNATAWVAGILAALFVLFIVVCVGADFYIRHIGPLFR